MAGTSERLTRREQEVLALIRRGWADKEVAAELGMSCATVRTHVARLKEKLGASNRTQIGDVARAIEDRRNGHTPATDGHHATDGNRAIGQSGNRAIRQSGNRAIGQSGNRAIGEASAWPMHAPATPSLPAAFHPQS